MISVEKLIQTCGACPSQWEFYTFDNRPVYVRYRWGYLSICIGPENGDIESAVLGKNFVGVVKGGNLDGSISWRDVQKELDALSREEVLRRIGEEKPERHLTPIEADAEGRCVCERFRKESILANFCYKCGRDLRTT